MNYKEALEYLNNLAMFGSRLGLERMRDLLEVLERPERSLRIIHVAGTNGKGSVSAFLASILQQAGYSVGLYTSPHLSRYNERITVDGQPISDDDLARALTRVRDAVGGLTGQGQKHPTQFEVGTAAMYVHFSQVRPDFVIQEVGLGGRLDATNALSEPLLTVITSVDLDHTEVLGEDLASVAREKAGILKKGVPLILGPQKDEAREAIMERAGDLSCPVIGVVEEGHGEGQVLYRPLGVGPQGSEFDYREIVPGSDTEELTSLRTSLLGGHQIPNGAVAAAAARYLDRVEAARIPTESIRSGLSQCLWPGRLEVIKESPLVVVDGAHNPAGARALACSLKEIWPSVRPVLVFSAQEKKRWPDMLRTLAEVSGEVILTKVPWGPSTDPVEAASVIGRGRAIPDLREAVATALGLAEAGGMVVITGSLYLVGPAREMILKGDI